MRADNVVEWERLSWVEIPRFLKGAHTVMIPIGSVEQHGPALPLGFDTYVADTVCLKACKILLHEGVGALKLPPLWFGLSSMWMSFRGTITLKTPTLYLLMGDLLESLVKSGVKHVTVVNGHAGNNDALRTAVRDSVERYPELKALVVNVWDIVGDVIKESFRTPFFHADEVETSVALYLGLCREDPRRISGEDLREFRSYGWWHSLDLTVRPKAYVFTAESSKKVGSGAFGRPDLASGGKGGYLLDVMAERIAKLVKETVEA